MDTMECNGEDDFSNDLYAEQSLLLGGSRECNFLREQEIFPRIGEDYQVEIPALCKRSDYFSNEKNRTDLETHALNFFTGLPMPLISINRDGGKQEKGELGKVASGESSDVDFGKELHQCTGSGSNLVPGSACHSWNDAEKASFLLGLYIFSRNFAHLKRFLESKTMEDILSFYYGGFYKSYEYCRWSECRKMRRRGVVGQKIFTGLRQQEFLSRVLPSMSEEGKSAVLEVCKMLGEGKIEFEDFIFSMKNLVGINSLEEAVGIGKGKQDLTTMSNQVIPVIPIGKACSLLTSSEIVKYLTGNYRLSKARSNDLFWEAVWPRLLAKGWHSEEAKDIVYAAGTRHSLVFLVPGIVKFSRRKLTKGNHYFDSVTDVLNKVASDPGLMELENDYDESKKSHQEHELNKDVKSEEDDGPAQKRPCYLQPRTPERTMDGMKFTVVDTSMDDGKPYKVRELIGLSYVNRHKNNSVKCNEIIDNHMSEVSNKEVDAVDTPISNEVQDDGSKGLMDLSHGEIHPNSENLDTRDPVQVLHPCPDTGSVHATENKLSSVQEKAKEVVNICLSYSMKENDLCNRAPAIKRRRRLNACNRAETGNVGTSMSEVPHGQQYIPRLEMMNTSAVRGNLNPEHHAHSSPVHGLVEPSALVSPHDERSLDSPAKSIATDNVECAAMGNSSAFVNSQEACHNQNSFDLNVTPDCENGFLVTKCNEEHDETDKGQSDNDLLSRGRHCSQQQFNVNPQRRGTRSRPPTTRALEAVAFGFLSVNSRQKGEKKVRSRSSRRAGGAKEISDIQTDTVAPILQDSQSGASSGSNRSELGEFQVLPEVNGPPFSGP